MPLKYNKMPNRKEGRKGGKEEGQFSYWCLFLPRGPEAYSVSFLQHLSQAK